MGYDLHIERPRDRKTGEITAPITLADWTGAVESTENVRLTTHDHVAKNPRTKEVIRMSGAPGDVEVFFPDEQTWHHVFRWRPRGTVAFRAPDDIPGEPVMPIARVLAKKLKAGIRGDGGEQYK